MAFGSAATQIVAQLFQLISNSGTVLAELGSYLGFPALKFKHNDPSYGDSQIYWSTTDGVTAEVNLLGPQIVDAGATIAPELHLGSNDLTHQNDFYLRALGSSSGRDVSLTGARSPAVATGQLLVSGVTGANTVQASMNAASAAGFSYARLEHYIAATAEDNVLSVEADRVDIKPGATSRVKLNGRNVLLPLDVSQTLGAARAIPLFGGFLTGYSITGSIEVGDILECSYMAAVVPAGADFNSGIQLSFGGGGSSTSLYTGYIPGAQSGSVFITHIYVSTINDTFTLQAIGGRTGAAGGNILSDSLILKHYGVR